MTLDSRLLHRLSNGLAELYLPGGGDFAGRVINLVSGLIAVESCSYNHVRTVHTRLQHIYRTLGVSSRTEALAQVRALSLDGAASP